MLLGSLSAIERAIRESWSAQTCDPVDRDVWSPVNPSRGQCAVTALVVQDLLGGELLLAAVRYDDGTRQGLHYWNRLAGGAELDLTRAQFAPNELVGDPEVIPRPADTTKGRLAGQYAVLAAAVHARLRRDPAVVSGELGIDERDGAGRHDARQTA